MKKLFIIFLTFFPLCLMAQLDTCTYTQDTLLKIDYCHATGSSLCPYEKIYIDTTFVHYVTGMKTYLVCYNDSLTNGCVSELQLGTINFGDTIPITFTQAYFNFFTSPCNSGVYKVAIIAIGKPTVPGENYYCNSSIHYHMTYTYDGCGSSRQTSVHSGTSANCTVGDCSVTGGPLLQENHISVFPNPVKSNLTSQLRGFFDDNTTMTLCNMAGQVVFFKTIHSVTESTDVAFLENGAYMLILRNGKGIIRHISVIKIK